MGRAKARPNAISEDLLPGSVLTGNAWQHGVSSVLLPVAPPAGEATNLFPAS